MSQDSFSLADLPLLRILERLHEPCLVTDAAIDPPGPRILYVNPAFTRMTGYTRDDLRNRTPRVLQGPATSRRLLDRLRACLEAGETFEGETVNYRRDGTAFLMQWYIEPVRNSDGEITHFFAVQRDVTAEREEAEQRRALEQAIGQLSELVVIFGPKGTVRYANKSYLRWCKGSRKDVIGSQVWKIPGAPRQADDLRWARRKLRAARGWQREYEIRDRSTPDDRFVFVTVTPIRDAAGRISEFVAVGRDVTEHRRLTAIAEAQSFHDNLGVVFAGLRHELGNPINSIKTALQVVTDSHETMSREKLTDYLERMGEEIGRVEYLLRSLRNYGLHDKPRPEAVDARSFLESFRELAMGNAESRAVSVDVHVAPEVELLWADPLALHQVLLNLLGNAFSALEGASDGRVEILAEREGRRVALTVRDNGPGIPSERLPHVFKPFYTTRAGGTGLGLAICRHLLSLMGGSIRLRSSSDGTEARMLLGRPPAPTRPDELSAEDRAS